ncbi:MAG: hypothetical protein KBI47_14095 [Armatimonadetes bacterium]|jgi:FtsH-binding integral membrane protein|nr:hypothetical protein [Armatimonadota bacterium]MDI9587081.1 hypothetical protein [Acidobacteriota bacterium]
MRRQSQLDERVTEARRQMQRTWLMWGIGPLCIATVLMFTSSAVWASPANVDEHILERGFQAVLAICSALFLTGFWLDGRWTNPDRIAHTIWSATCGGEFVPTRSQLAGHASIAFSTIAGSAKLLTIIGGAIAAAAVISVWAGLRMSDGAQLLLLGLCYQVFVLSRHPRYEEILSAAVRGELVFVDAPDHNNND